MTDSAEKTIYQAILTAIQALSLPSGWTKVLPDDTYTPTATSRFVSFEVHFNRSIETDLTLEMDPIRQGFIRANVYLPKSWATVDAYEVAGQVRTAFKRGTKLYRTPIEVLFEQDPELANLLKSDTHNQVPLTAFWRSY